MKKEDLVAKVSNDVGISKDQASAAVAAVIGGIFDALKRGEKVTLVGFGTFEVVQRAPRTVRLPGSTEKTTVPGKRSVRFRPGKELRNI